MQTNEAIEAAIKANPEYTAVKTKDGYQAWFSTWNQRFFTWGAQPEFQKITNARVQYQKRQPESQELLDQLINLETKVRALMSTRTYDPNSESGKKLATFADNIHRAKSWCGTFIGYLSDHGFAAAVNGLKPRDFGKDPVTKAEEMMTKATEVATKVEEMLRATLASGEELQQPKVTEKQSISSTAQQDETQQTPYQKAYLKVQLYYKAHFECIQNIATILLEGEAEFKTLSDTIESDPRGQVKVTPRKAPPPRPPHIHTSSSASPSSPISAVTKESSGAKDVRPPPPSFVRSPSGTPPVFIPVPKDNTAVTGTVPVAPPLNPMAQPPHRRAPSEVSSSSIPLAPPMGANDAQGVRPPPPAFVRIPSATPATSKHLVFIPVPNAVPPGPPPLSLRKDSGASREAMATRAMSPPPRLPSHARPPSMGTPPRPPRAMSPHHPRTESVGNPPPPSRPLPPPPRPPHHRTASVAPQPSTFFAPRKDSDTVMGSTSSTASTGSAVSPAATEGPLTSPRTRRLTPMDTRSNTPFTGKMVQAELAQSSGCSVSSTPDSQAASPILPPPPVARPAPPPGRPSTSAAPSAARRATEMAHPVTAAAEPVRAAAEEGKKAAPGKAILFSPEARADLLRRPPPPAPPAPHGGKISFPVPPPRNFPI